MTPSKLYLIAFTVRSGSTLLCEYLSANGLGKPVEFFQYPYGVANRRIYDSVGVRPDDFQGYLRAVTEQFSPNGIFGAKLAWDHKNVLLEECRRHGLAATDVSDLFPGVQWIYLKRRDKAAQAISAWRAVQTGRWHSVEPESKAPRPEYATLVCSASSSPSWSRSRCGTTTSAGLALRR